MERLCAEALHHCWREPPPLPCCHAVTPDRGNGCAGFMSNRGRQNVASFLVLDLNLDWRLGADWCALQPASHMRLPRSQALMLRILLFASAGPMGGVAAMCAASSMVQGLGFSPSPTPTKHRPHLSWMQQGLKCWPDANLHDEVLGCVIAMFA